MKRWMAAIGGILLIGSVVLVLRLTVWNGDDDTSAEATSSDGSAEPLGPEEECYVAVMNYLGEFPDALSQGYQGVDLRPLQTQYGVQSKTVQVARHYSVEITQKILLEGDPTAQLTAISPKVAADCGVN